VSILAGFAFLALQSGAVMTILALALEDLGTSTDVGSTMAVFLAGNLVGMSVVGVLCRWVRPGRVVLMCMFAGATGLALAAVARGLPIFLLGRAMQGVGNGACMVALYVITAVAFGGPSRSRLLRGISTAWMLPTIVGPWVAGIGAEQLGWRAVFAVGAAGLVIAGLLAGVTARRVPGLHNTVRPRVVAASALAAVGVCGLQLLPFESLGLLLIGAVCCAALILVGAAVMLPRRTLALGRGVPTGIALRGILAGAFFGVEAWVPLLLIERDGLTAEHAGLVIGSGGICWIAGAWFQGWRRTPDATGSRIRVLFGACLVTGSGITGVALVAALGGSPVEVGLCWAVACLGMGAAMPGISILVFDQSAKNEYAESSVGLQSSDALGCALVVATCGVLFAVLHSVAVDVAYGAVFALGAALAVGAAAVAPRLRPVLITNSADGRQPTPMAP
jgi:MFS family permease